ncbi:hypothetical protein EN792_036635, partial [Mesorhizobium sp. M00.F.Ca.ET.149.01.1.1]
MPSCSTPSATGASAAAQNSLQAPEAFVLAQFRTENRFFQQVKIPREFCFAPCQIGREREGHTLLPDVACLPENRAGRRCKRKNNRQGVDHMKRIVLGLLAATAMVLPAFAADVQPA